MLRIQRALSKYLLNKHRHRSGWLRGADCPPTHAHLERLSGDVSWESPGDAQRGRPPAVLPSRPSVPPSHLSLPAGRPSWPSVQLEPPRLQQTSGWGRRFPDSRACYPSPVLRVCDPCRRLRGRPPASPVIGRFLSGGGAEWGEPPQGSGHPSLNPASHVSHDESLLRNCPGNPSHVLEGRLMECGAEHRLRPECLNGGGRLPGQPRKSPSSS